MQLFIESGVNPDNLILLNEMRMSIWAISLADISTADRRRISADSWRLRQSNHLRDDLIWPRKVQYFTEDQIKLWQTSLKQAFVWPNAPPSECRTIWDARILHHWIRPGFVSKWQYRYSTAGVIYKKSISGWRVYLPRDGRDTRSQRF